MTGRAKDAYKLAGEMTRKLGMVPTGANVQTVRLAIESEADYSGVSLDEAANVIAKAAKEFSRGSSLRCLSDWEDREISRLNSVDRFWFEDSRWRDKLAYAKFRAVIEAKDCSLHPQSGLTQWGTCWACYAARCGSEGATA